jgi:hypothetical protein
VSCTGEKGEGLSEREGKSANFLCSSNSQVQREHERCFITVVSEHEERKKKGKKKKKKNGTMKGELIF